ncbi:LLM class flavin-dependent oxidoreductase [Gloeocapsa sp. PCC 73106]|uniref:LLM class flavin-dependent oxidoreductase n=1 Tax=Gloeocapsa sp. PCC 73106 TaxID=102232 RepID=UPI0002AC14CA|nr:LLM class flavin-dependent oxidoreductase [Gloeocapsa sp. PCC 73106]ELR97618.1 natural product biosynthesis luciferase-like monooxygenase domain [Gloeocapsa sp. PCC 73106]
MDFSLFYFDGDGSTAQANQYQLLIESAKFADRNNLVAIWTPERHFHAFGGLYPNPSITAAALAMVTEKIQLRAGSVVVPLHHPVRIAEEWAVVDNLSNGRVEIAFASGWTIDEFILSSEPHANRRATMWRGIKAVQRLWRGEAYDFQDAIGRTVSAKTLPKPIQPHLPTWIACQSSETFMEAGKMGANVLTSLLGGTIEEVAPKISLYRKSLAKHGHQNGKVALMLHTFLGEEIDEVKAKVKEPFCQYLKTHYDLLGNLAKGMGLDVNLKNFSEDDLESLLLFGVESFMKGRSLIGTPRSCLPFVEKIRQIGVDEIACLIDFVPDFDSVMDSLPYLKQLRDSCQAVGVTG